MAARAIICGLVVFAAILAGCAPANPRMTEELRYLQEDDCSTALLSALGSANQGDPAGQYNMGFLWQRGCGVPRHYRNAYDWYVLAARSGEPRAMIALGDMHKSGMSVELDAEKAAGWYTLAARYGNTEARQRLVSLGKPVPAADLANPAPQPQTVSAPNRNAKKRSTRGSGFGWLKEFGAVLLYAAASYYGAQAATTNRVVYREVDIPRYAPPRPSRFQTTCIVSAMGSNALVNCN